MGFIFSKSMNENMKSQQEFMLMNARLQVHFYFFNFLKKFYLFLAALGLRCCTWAFSSCREQGLVFIAEHGL